MHVVLYNNKPEKRVNGSVFYCFEYYMFLKQVIPNIKFVLMNTTPDELMFYKSIFLYKYVITETDLDNMCSMSRIEYMTAPFHYVLILDVSTYRDCCNYLGKAKQIYIYCNKPDGAQFFNAPRVRMYGWYDYQPCHVRTRLKLFRELHRTYETSGTNVFLSSPNGNNPEIANLLQIPHSVRYLKAANTHIENLFKQIGSIVYYHTGANDANNRIIIEAAIHDIPLTVHLNGFTNDSVADRYSLVRRGVLTDVFLTTDDVLVNDFVKGE